MSSAFVMKFKNNIKFKVPSETNKQRSQVNGTNVIKWVRKVFKLFEGTWLLNISQFTIKINIGDNKMSIENR